MGCDAVVGAAGDRNVVNFELLYECMDAHTWLLVEFWKNLLNDLMIIIKIRRTYARMCDD
jgi:hypothetical protein